jgi:peroxiredoxin
MRAATNPTKGISVTDTDNSLIKPGATAPEFALPSGRDRTVKLSQFRGRPVVLVFYPADWSPVCGDQVALYNELLTEFQAFDAQLLGISVDGVWCHAAFTADRKLQFPLLADFEPKGAVARQYGSFEETGGFCKRALVVIDATGIVRWSYVSPIGVNPGADGILSALEKLPKPGSPL